MSITSGTRVAVAPHEGQGIVTSSIAGRCGSTPVTSPPASSPSSLSDPTAVSWPLPHRQIGHHLAVDLDPGLQDTVHELRVGEAVLARRGVDALDPQAAERTLLVAPVAVGILQALLDLLDADAERRLGAATIALGEL